MIKKKVVTNWSDGDKPTTKKDNEPSYIAWFVASTRCGIVIQKPQNSNGNDRYSTRERKKERLFLFLINKRVNKKETTTFIGQRSSAGAIKHHCCGTVSHVAFGMKHTSSLYYLQQQQQQPKRADSSWRARERGPASMRFRFQREQHTHIQSGLEFNAVSFPSFFLFSFPLWRVCVCSLTMEDGGAPGRIMTLVK